MTINVFVSAQEAMDFWRKDNTGLIAHIEGDDRTGRLPLWFVGDPMVIALVTPLAQHLRDVGQQAIRAGNLPKELLDEYVSHHFGLS